MSGNVWEWVQDRYDADYYDQTGAEKNPINTKPSGSNVIRGGSWDDNPHNLRASNRDWNDPLSWNINIGFRCAMTP